MAKKEKYYMIGEIREQPRVLRRILDTRLDDKNNKVDFSEFRGKIKSLRQIERFVFLGCGTSANAAMLGNYYFEDIARVNAEYEFADEFISRQPVLGKDTAVIILSQSGRTRDAISAAKLAKKDAGLLITVCNNQKSPLSELADVSLCACAGGEKALAATKSFTAQVLTLVLLAFYFAQIFKIKIKDKRNFFTSLDQVSVKLRVVLRQEALIKKMAKQIVLAKDLPILGRTYHFPIALEAAHKIKESAYIFAQGFASEEFRHGPEAVLDKNSQVIMFIFKDNNYQNNLTVLRELKATGAQVFVFADSRTKELKKLSKVLFGLPKTDKYLRPFLSIAAAQLLAFYLGLEKNINLNKSRNISKFVA